VDRFFFLVFVCHVRSRALSLYYWTDDTVPYIFFEAPRAREHEKESTDGLDKGPYSLSLCSDILCLDISTFSSFLLSPTGEAKWREALAC